jgi:hypothetical protein
VSGVRSEVDAAWDRFEVSSVPAQWRKDNPGEWEAIANYRRSDGQAPDGIETQFGLGLLALVNAGKLGDGTFQGG